MSALSQTKNIFQHRDATQKLVTGIVIYHFVRLVLQCFSESNARSAIDENMVWWTSNPHHPVFSVYLYEQC